MARIDVIEGSPAWHAKPEEIIKAGGVPGPESNAGHIEMSDDTSQAEKDAAEQREVERRFSDAIGAKWRGLSSAKAEEDRKAAARSENVEHKRHIDLAAQVAITRILVEESVGHGRAAIIAKAIVIALAAGRIPNAKLEY